MNAKRYASDVTDGEGRILELLMPAAKPGGRPRGVNLREVVNGIFYLVKTGCQWRKLQNGCRMIATRQNALEICKGRS